MIWENIFFGVIAAAMAISALGVVTTKNVVHAALFLAGILGGLLVHEFHGIEINLTSPVRTSEVTNAIFRTYLIPFEVVGVLLLGALVGAVVLARRD